MLVVGAEWRGFYPVVRVGIATRVGETFRFGADAERRFQHGGTAGKLWGAFAW